MRYHLEILGESKGLSYDRMKKKGKTQERERVS